MRAPGSAPSVSQEHRRSPDLIPRRSDHGSHRGLRRYVAKSVVGGVAWAAGLSLLGHWLGQIAVVRDHIELFILAIVALSLVPVAVEVLRGRAHQHAA